MKTKKYLLFSFLFLFFGCFSSKKDACETKYVSIISLIANPEKYNNKKVNISGYFNITRDGEAVYNTKVDFENGLFKNAIYLSINYNELYKFNIEPPYRGYVQIEGIFTKYPDRFKSHFSGRLSNITKIKRLYKIESDSDEFNDN